MAGDIEYFAELAVLWQSAQLMPASALAWMSPTAGMTE
jgi:hypothetical protein